MRSYFFWDVTQLIVVVTDVSVQPIGPALKGSTGYPETSVNNYQSALRVTGVSVQPIGPALKGSTGCHETSVNNYQSALRVTEVSV